MVVYTLKQRFKILRHYFENHGNVAERVRKLRTDFGRREAPSSAYVRCYLVKKVKETGILINKQNNIAAVAESVCVKHHQDQFTVFLNN